MKRLLSQLIVNPDSCPNSLILSSKGGREDERVRTTASAYGPIVHSDPPHTIPLMWGLTLIAVATLCRGVPVVFYEFYKIEHQPHHAHWLGH